MHVSAFATAVKLAAWLNILFVHDKECITDGVTSCLAGHAVVSC